MAGHHKQVFSTACYSADGDQAMALCEVTNSSAFSHNTSETETSRTSYESACKALEAGYHVAFSTDQDNHCANWGASYTNRTGILIPNGTALSMQSFLDAVKARHVFATYDKTSQIVLTTSGGHLMGDRFNNSGALTLTVNYAPGSGRCASQVQLFQGVPGSNGTVAVLSTTAVTTTTPATGDHFYYAKVTQDNGTLLYSAPVWVTQGSGGGGGGGTPVANFSFATSGLTATFTDSSTDSGGTISAHAWTFGDGATSTATSPSHTYAAAGTFSVSETVTDSVNATTSSKTSSVTVATAGARRRPTSASPPAP